MPDCLEMPYWPNIQGAETLIGENAKGYETEERVYRLGGNSCLSGDFLGYWRFAKPLHVGDEIFFEDMIHYTTVKTTMFNGVSHPSIGIVKENGELVLLKQFTHQDYFDRMC